MEIIPGLFLGRSEDSERMQDVHLVVNCSNNLPFHAELARQVRIGVDDNGLVSEVGKLAAILSDMTILRDIDASLQRDERVLVHCRMGQQRSAAVVAAYLMYAQGLTPSSAMELVKLRKPDAFLCRANFEAALWSLQPLISSQVRSQE